MFAEEDEWNDEPEAKNLTTTLFSNPKTDSANAKLQSVGKKSLLRTLQKLGSVPDWTKTGVTREGSDSEPEAVPSQPKRKKRIKRRKRGAAKREEAEKDSGETSVKEESVVIAAKKPKISGPTEVKSSGDEVKKTELNTGTLTRKQWRNKMKNQKKKIGKNKYLPNGQRKQEAVKPANQNPKVGQEVNSDVKDEKPPTQKPNQQTVGSRETSKRKKVQEGNKITPIVDKETLTYCKNDNNLKKAAKKTKGGGHVSGVALERSDQLKQEVGTVPYGNRVEEQPGPSKRRSQIEIRAHGRKVEKLRRLLQVQGSDRKDEPTEKEQEEVMAPQVPADRSSILRSRMQQRLEAAQFRYINEVLYTTSSGEAKRMFRQDPEAFGIYHKGFTAQVKRWPANPVDSIISSIRHKPSSLVVADFGCGDCKIASSVKNKVHSFDLAPVCDQVTVCDMANVPLDDATVDIAVFCLSLMGTNLGDFLVEANRVLVMGGMLQIAEVASRFENVRSFMSAMASLGFKLVSKDTENSHFYLFEFVKTAEAPENVKAGLELRPCLYKKR
ncbi:ribosomal RNA-processing protein 8 [Osmerus mordax]|uniref:ribosomal RNA-processing protein 8 n=1 Tax=Osmerus mordax TaxID=8014 RepID=UPI00350F6EEB